MDCAKWVNVERYIAGGGVRPLVFYRANLVGRILDYTLLDRQCRGFHNVIELHFERCGEGPDEFPWHALLRRYGRSVTCHWMGVPLERVVVKTDVTSVFKACSSGLDPRQFLPRSAVEQWEECVWMGNVGEMMRAPVVWYNVLREKKC